MKRLLLVILIISTGFSRKIKTTQFDEKKSYKIYEATQKGNIILEDKITTYYWDQYKDFDMEKFIDKKVVLSDFDFKRGYILDKEETFYNPGNILDVYEKKYNSQGLLIEEGKREKYDKVGKWKYIIYLFQNVDGEEYSFLRKFKCEVIYKKTKRGSEVVSVENTGNPDVYYDAENGLWRYEMKLYYNKG